MKICLFSEFSRDAASCILMEGRAACLADMGHAVCMIVQPFKNMAFNSSTVETKGHLKTLPLYNLWFSRTSLISRLKGLIYLLGYQIPLAFWYMRKSSLVVLQSPQPLSFLYALLLKISGFRGKVVCILDDWAGIGGFATMRHADSLIARLILTFTDEVTPLFCDGLQCASKLQLIKSNYSRKLASRTIYLPNGTAALIPENELISHEGEIHVGYVGTFKSSLLINFLVEVISSACLAEPRLRFHLIGGGDQLTNLQQQLDKRQLSGNCIVFGMIPHNDVLARLRNLDICIITLSDTFPEAYLDSSRSSTKLFEYMAAGKAIIASKTGEPSEILVHMQSGILCPNDADIFAKALSLLASDPILRNRLGQNGYELYDRNFRQEILMQKLLDWAKTL